MPRYLFAVHHDDGVVRMTPERQEQAFRDTGEFNERLDERGALVFAGGLVPAEGARVIDARGDAPVVTDGPAIDATRRLGGFWIVEAADDAAALALAEAASRACNEPVEVRAFLE